MDTLLFIGRQTTDIGFQTSEKAVLRKLRVSKRRVRGQTSAVS